VAKINNDSIFDGEDINFLITFNGLCRISLDNAQVFRNSYGHTQLLGETIDISNSRIKTIDPLKSLENILKHVQKLMNASRATIFLLNQEINELSFFITNGSKIKGDRGI
jgi:hypothetical protein